MMSFVVSFAVYLVSTATVIWFLKWFNKKPSVLQKIQGPKTIPILGNSHELNPGYTVHLKLTDWAKKYGPVYRMKLMGKYVVIVTGLKEIYEVLVTKGRHFAGRTNSFRIKYMMENKSDMLSLDYGPDNIYRRKLLHGHLKQYGEGLTKIETETREIVRKMLEGFVGQKGKTVDVEKALQDATIDLTYILLLGEVLTDEEERKNVGKVIKYMVDILSASGNGIWLDLYPWLRFFGHQTFRDLKDMRGIRRALTAKWRERAEISKNPQSIIFNLLQVTRGSNEFKLNDLNVDHLTWQLFFGATSTTVATLASLVNILAVKPDIQDKLQQEIDAKLSRDADVSFKNRGDLPYCYATILETTRYTSVLPIGIPHMSMRDTSIGDYEIPADTPVWTNLWGLHHDDDIWTNPYEFCPQRFLTEETSKDENGATTKSYSLVPADHPLRKAHMAFSAGPRVCTGETFAMTRMFMILTMMMQKFRILPETDDVTKQPSCDPREMKLGGVLYPQPFKVRFVERS